MELHAFIISLLLLTIVSESQSRSLEPVFQCATTCEEPVNFQFAQGYMYQFLYEATVISSFNDAATQGQRSQVNIQATTHIDVLGPCELVLRITSANIRDDNSYPVSTTEWQESLSRHPLHFNWQDGRIPEICASNNDPTWVLNIKRGILSTLQVSSMDTVESVKEMDVTGNCESSYIVETNSRGLDITKTKDYNTCEDREKYLLFSHFTPYQSDSPRQNFIHSKQTCTQSVREGTVLRSTCDEEHTFRPFSNEESGARTTIHQTLTSQGLRQPTYQGDTLSFYDARRKTLMFEKEESSSVVSRDITELQDVFGDVCITMSREEYKQVGQQFIRMVFLLRRLDAPALEQAYSALNGACPTWETALRGMFQDALQWCGSEGCVLFATRLIATGQENLPDGLASRWIAGMSLIEHPTLPMIREMMTVVRSGILSQRSYLATGTMINRYCAESDTNCLTEPIISSALSMFQDKLGVNCRTTNVEQKQDILLSLRALGNAGQTTSINLLASCAQETSNDMETRIAAVQAYRRMSCNTDRAALNAIVFDDEEDSEIRIASYIAIMKCPTPKFIQQLTALLDREPVKQVASFVWSHLHQLLESTDPLKNYIKPLLLETEFTKQHDLDPRKYSRFYEASFFADTLNSGATVESSVVWSPKSFVPRSGDLDLTVNVLGQSVNLLQMGGRVEGVETMIQSMLQSEKGFLKNNPISDLFMEVDDEDSEEVDVEETSRESRSIDTIRSSQLQRQFKTGLNTEDKPKASWYLRLFNNEMMYGNTQSMQTEPLNVRPILAQMAQGGEYHYHDDTMLVNSAHVLPTGIGLPLTIAFNGTASMDLRANGNLDMTGLFSSSPSLTMHATFNPRAVVLVTGWMSVDAHVTRTGIATESSAVTSWTLGGRASITNGRQFEVHVDAPYERNTLFSFNHKLMKLDGDSLIDIGEEQQSNQRSCSSEYAAQHVCLETPRNRAIFPVDGPITMSVYSEKTDSGFDHYLLTAGIHAHDDEEEHDYHGMFPPTMHGSITMDTPGSTVDRETTLKCMYNMLEKRFSISLRQPENQMRLKGSITSDPTSRELALTYIRNGITYEYEGHVERHQDGTEMQWRASSSLQLPSKTIAGSATAIANPAGKVALNISIENIFDSPVLFDVSIEDKSERERNRFQYSGNSQIMIPGLADTGLRFDMNIKPKTDVFALALHYEFVGSEEQHLHFSHKRRNRSTTTFTDWSAEQRFVFSQYPRFNHVLELAHKNRAGSVSSYVNFKYGKHAAHEDNRRFILLNQTLEYSTDSSSTQIEGHANIKMPQFDMDHQASLRHVYSPTTIDTNLTIDAYGVRLYGRDSTVANGLINREISLEFPLRQGNVRMNSSIEETAKGVYAIRGQIGVGGATGLSMIGRCDIENLDDRKSLAVQITGDSNQNLLDARLLGEVLNNSASYNFESSIVSVYNNLITLNFRHEHSFEVGFESNFTFDHSPDKHFQVFVDFENESERAKRLVRVDFKDLTGILRSIKIEGNRESTSSDNNYEPPRHSGSISFTNDFPSIPVRNLIVNGHLSISSSSDVGGSVTFNDVELVGGQGSYEYSVREDHSGSTTLSINLRQGKCTSMPGSVSFNGNILNTLNEGNVVSGTYSHDGESKLLRFRVNQDNTEVQGEVMQDFFENIAHDISFVVTRLENGLNVEVTSNERPAALRLEKDENSITAAWTNRNPQLIKLGAPRKVDATLVWGKKGDDIIGAWLTSMINDAENLKMNIEYSRASGHSIVANLKHNIQAIRDHLPQIQVNTTFLNLPRGMKITHTVQSNDDILEDFLMKWDSNSFVYNYKHSLELLSTIYVPKSTVANITWAMPSNSILPSAELSLSVDESTTTLSFGTFENSILFKYFSNCSFISCHFGMNIERLTGRQAGLNITTIYNGETKHAEVSYNFDNEHQSYSFQLAQSLYQNPTIADFPENVNIEVTVPQGHLGVSISYNQYDLVSENSWAWQENINKYVLDYSMEQNFTQYIYNYRIHNEIVVLPAKFDFAGAYAMSDNPERMFKLSMQYTDESTNSLKEVSALLTQEEPYFIKLGIPEVFKVDASLAYNGRDIKGSVVAAVDGDMRQIALVGGIDGLHNNIRLSLTHDVPYLAELGLFRNLTAHAHAHPIIINDIASIKIGSWVQINEQNYRVGFNGSFRSPEEEQVVISEIGFEHNIALLSSFKVPLRTSVVTDIVYSIMDRGLSGDAGISSTITCTVLDPETSEKIDVIRHVNASVDLQLFSYKATVAASHDFEVDFLPKTIVYELAASSSQESSIMLHKFISMALTIDGKKQKASLTVNMNPSQNSFLMIFNHNVTEMLKYGLPGKFEVDFRLQDTYNADLSIIYDTSKKSIGFEFDYDGDRNKVQFYVNHNFDFVEEHCKIPKTFGFETSASINDHEADGAIRYVWGPVIKTGHANVNWDLSPAMPSIGFHHSQNITTNAVFPRKATFRWSSSYDQQGFNAKLRFGRKHVKVEFNADTWHKWIPLDGTLTFTQTIFQDELPKNTIIESTLHTGNDSPYGLDIKLYCDRKYRFHSFVNVDLNTEEISGSLATGIDQDFVELEQFPSSMEFYSNISLLEDGFQTYAKLQLSDLPPLVVSLKSKINIESSSGFVEFNHSQQNWKKAGVPKKLRIDATYRADVVENQRSISFVVRRGRQENLIRIGSGFKLTDNLVFGRVDYTHNFSEYEESMPLSGTANLLLAKNDGSLTAQANATLGTQSFIHSIEALYNIEESEFLVSFEALQDNSYLEQYSVPHTVAFSSLGEFEDESVGAMTIKTQYGDRRANLRLSSNFGTTAKLNFTHTWPVQPNEVRLVLDGSTEDQQGTLSVYIDGVEKDIRLSGSMNEGGATVSFEQNLLNAEIPAEVVLQASYRTSPDMYLSIHATIDGQEYSIAGGFTKLDDGFHITSTLLDDITRTAIFRNTIVPGGFSVEIDHTVPELLNYLPGSVGIAASARMNPRPNVTASVRQQTETRVFSTEVDVNALRFALQHDFELLSLPRSITLELKGTRSPWSGTINLEMDGTMRTMSGSLDSENLVGNFLHNMPELPLPESLQISLGGSTTPPSGSINITINGIGRSAYAEVDTDAFTSRFEHTFPELDRMFIARDIIVGLSASSEPISGEIYLSLDGLERRVGGSVDSIDASRDMSASFIHSIPEVDSYIPRHVSVSSTFTSSSVILGVECTKDGIDRNVTLGIDFNPNHLRLQISHNIETGYNLLQEASIDLSGDLENLNFTVSTSADRTYVNVGGQLINGEEDWYGISLEAGHNIEAAEEVLNNLDFAVKGRKHGQTWEGAVVMNLLKDHDYSATASITPKRKSKRTVIRSTYDHIYNGSSRSMTGSIIVTKKSDQNRLTLEFEQTALERREILIRSFLSSEIGDQYQFTVGLDTSHDLPFLAIYRVPERIENGRASLTIIPSEYTMRGEANANVDDQPMTYSFDIRGHPESTDITVNADFVVDNGHQNTVYTGEVRSHYTIDDTPISFYRHFTAVDRDSGDVTRDEEITFTLTVDPFNPHLRLLVEQPELNELGVPSVFNAFFNVRCAEPNNLYFRLHFDIDNRAFDVINEFAYEEAPFDVRLRLSLNNSVSYLESLFVPDHISLSFGTNFEHQDQGHQLNDFTHFACKLMLRYNDYKVMQNLTAHMQELQGTISREFQHNIPEWNEYLSFNQVTNTFSYTIIDNVYTLSRISTKDHSTHVETENLIVNNGTKEVVYSYKYDNIGAELVLQFNRTAEETSAHINLIYEEEELFLFDVFVTKMNGKITLMNKMFETPFSGSVTVQGDEDEATATLSGTIKGVERNGFVGHTPFNLAGKEGKAVRIYYNEEGRTINAILKGGVSSDRSSAFFDLDWENHYWSVAPRSIRYSFKHEPTVITSQELSIDDVQVSVFDLSPAVCLLKVRDLNGDLLFSAIGNYTHTPNKLFNASVACPPLAIDLALSGALKIFESGTGNSSMVCSLVNNLQSERFDLTVFVLPTGRRPSDLSVSSSAVSSMAKFPFNINMKYNSMWDDKRSVYSHDIHATYNEKVFSFDGNYSETFTNMQLMQSYISPPTAIAVHFTVDSEKRRNHTLQVLWGEEEDKLELTCSCKVAEYNFDWSMHGLQPSAILGISDIAGSFDVDHRQEQTLKFGVTASVNKVAGVAIDAAYTGVLPQVYGSHSLKVDVNQTLLTDVPAKFTTIGEMAIGSNGMYKSDWRITSAGQQLATLVKNYVPSETGFNVEFLWRQSYYQSIPLSFLSADASMATLESLWRADGKLQVGDMPEMSGKMELRSETTDERSNMSVTFNLATGALSKFVFLRGVSGSAWLNIGSDERQTAPQYSLTMTVDDKTFHVSGNSNIVSSRRTDRITADIQLSHPFDFKIFGKPVARDHSGSIRFLKKGRNSKVTLEYKTDHMRYPMEITTMYRLHNRNNLLSSTFKASFVPEEVSDDITMELNIVKEENNLDYEMTASMQYPERNMNGQVVIGWVNSGTNFGVNILAKDYSPGTVQTWDMRFSYSKINDIIEVFVHSPEIEATTLTGDLSEVIVQGKLLLQRLISNATSTRISFFKLFKDVDDGYDIHIGYIETDTNTYHSLRLLVRLNTEEAYIALQTCRDFQLVTEVARVEVVLSDARLVQIRMSADPKVVNFLQKVVSIFDIEFARKVNWFADNVIEFLESFKTVATGNEDIETISASYVDGIIAKVNAIRDLCIRYVSNAAVKSIGSFDSAELIVENSVRNGLTYLLDQIDRLLSIATQPFTSVREEYLGILLRKINAALLRQLRPITAMLRKANAGELFIELVSEGTDKTVEYLMKNGEATLIFVRGPLSELLAVTKTEVIMSIPLEFELDHFVPLPTLHDIKKWLAQSALAIKIDDTVNIAYSYIDEYYKGRTLLYIPRDEILPPFKGHTFVSGFRHFSTFDKRNYDFSSGCATSHILAADMRDNNFTVAISYADPLVRNSLNAIEVFVENQYVTVFSDYKVQVNQKTRQLPQDLEVISVTLEGTVVHIRDVKGDIDIACDFKKDLCTIDVSPYYFGATAGLAGVYNNEPIDDFTTPYHEKLDDEGEFAASWEVSDTSCLAGNTFRPCASNSASATCSFLFEDLKSPLRPCYPLVDPAPFMQMCQNDMCDAEDDSKSCAAASAYAYRCKQLGAPLLMPDACVTCTDARGDNFDASQDRSQDVSGLDLVFVMEQSSCMSRSGFGKAIRKFMKRVSGSLTEARMRNNHFHVVGYGGPGSLSRPSTVTFRSEPFTSRKGDVIKSTRKMKLTSEHMESDSLAAISYATQLQFRAGAKPVILHLSCSECSTISEVSYNNVEWQLRKQGINFHHVPTHKIGTGRKSKTVYGFDQTIAFGKLADLGRSAVKPSKTDACIPLATSTGGSVWDANMMTQSDFVAKFSRYIVDRAGPRSPQSCSCQMNDAGVGSAICT